MRGRGGSGADASARREGGAGVAVPLAILVDECLRQARPGDLAVSSLTYRLVRPLSLYGDSRKNVCFCISLLSPHLDLRRDLILPMLQRNLSPDTIQHAWVPAHPVGPRSSQSTHLGDMRHHVRQGVGTFPKSNIRLALLRCDVHLGQVKLLCLVFALQEHRVEFAIGQYSPACVDGGR